MPDIKFLLKCYANIPFRGDIKHVLFSLYYMKKNTDGHAGQSQLAHSLLFHALERENIHGYSERDIIKDVNGKPYFKNNAVHFNLSHSADYVLCGISDAEIGVDAEQPREALIKCARKIVTKDELPHLDNMPFKERLDYLLKKWTALEAYAKYTGQGVRQILNGAPRLDRVTDTLFKTVCGVYIHTIEVPCGMLCAASRYGEGLKVETVNNDEL